MLKYSKKEKNKKSKGFTLIELLITLSIFVVITGLVLFGQTQFNSSILLTNLAYDLALTIRQAQTFGVGGKIVPTVTMDTQPAYGIHVTTSDEDNANKSIIFFYDYPVGVNMGDGIFNNENGCQDTPTSADECVEKYNIKSGNKIKAICDIQGSNENCPESGGYDSVDITFKRPNPDARIIFDNEEDNLSLSGVQIDVGSDTDSQTRSVVVTSIGQIYVKN